INAFIDEHRGRFGVEPICKTLQFAPSTYYQAKKREVEPADRARRDAWLSGQIRRVHAENLKVYEAPEGVAAAGPGRHPGAALPGRAADAKRRPQKGRSEAAENRSRPGPAR